LIQCQVHARGLPRGSPRRLDLEAQAHDLLLAHEADWLGPMLGVVGNWEWRGGLLDWVTVAAEVFLANAERWLPALPLLGVHLRRARPCIADLARCEQLAHLNALYLGDNNLTDDDLEVLLGSKHLKRVCSLYLQSNDLGDRGARLLAQTPNLPRLRGVCLGHNRIGAEGVAALGTAPRLHRLRALDLSMTSLHEAGIQALAGAPLLSRLRFLTLGSNLLPGGCLAALVGAPAFAGVRELGYYFNHPDDADLAALANSPHSTGLLHLSLDGYQSQGDAGLRALARGPSLARLRSLSVGSGPWGAGAARALGRSRILSALRSLQMTPGAGGGRVVARALLGQPLVRRLRHLDLRVDRVGKADLEELASHPRPLRLRELDMPLARGTAAAWEMLLARGALTALTALTLTELPRGSLRALLVPGRLPELRRLTLHALPDLEECQALLDSPLLGRLHDLHISLAYPAEEQQGPQVVRRLRAVWNSTALRRLGLLWSLSAETVRLLTEVPPPPRLTELELGVFRMKAEGMAVLAGSQLLGQLRRLTFRNASSQSVPGLEALADSPQVGPLLRVDILNGNVPKEVVPALRRRFGIRFAVCGRMLPRTIHLGGWHKSFGDGED
jgi:hypothetical protein